MAEKPTEKPAFTGFGNFQFTSNLFGATQKPATEDSKAQLDDIEAEDENIQFTPVVKLQKVEQKEMEEEVLFTERGLCAKYDPSESTFKERGRGEVKILRHPTTKYSRVVLVRDQVLKLACNHFCLPQIKINKIPNNDKMLQYTVVKDFAREEEDKPMTLAFRFNTTEARDKFYDKFVEMQKEMETILKKD